MSESRAIEASGPDIEAAITKGIAELGVSRTDVMVEVLEEPSRGILGLGAHQARVRLTVIRAPAAPPPPSAPIEPARMAPPPSRPQPESGGRSAPSTPSAPTTSPARAKEFDVDDEWSDETLSAEELAEDAKIGAETLQELLGYLKVDAKVNAKAAEAEDDEPQHYTLEIQGRDLGALIGRRGETLAALQYITRLIASRDLERRVHIVIDVEGYKSRRESMLRRLAKRMADQAVQRNRTVSLEPMPPHERRIIHLALRDNPNVVTESVGEGDRRKVTIVPRRAR
jgi:spoIIIJ-associated protein